MWEDLGDLLAGHAITGKDLDMEPVMLSEQAQQFRARISRRTENAHCQFRSRHVPHSHRGEQIEPDGVVVQRNGRGSAGWLGQVGKGP